MGQSRPLCLIERASEAGHGRALGEKGIGEVIEGTPIFFQHDFYGFLKSYGNVAVMASRKYMSQFRVIERRLLMTEIVFERHVQDRPFGAVDKVLEMALARIS